MQHLFKL